MFWVRYGLLKQDNNVLLVNVIGLVLEVAYLAFYWHYTRNRAPLNRHISGMCALMGAVLLYVQYYSDAPNLSTTLSQLGIICVFFNILNFASPLAVLVSDDCACTVPAPPHDHCRAR